MGRPQTAVDPLFASSTTLPGLTGDGVGFAIATAGDVDGDGRSDVVVGAPFFGEGNAGRVYLYRGGPRPIATAPAQVLANDAEGGWFGYSVAAAGDVDGDGYDDVLVGAPSLGGSGAAFLHRGSSAGVALQASWRLDGTPGSTLGRTVAGAGDVNGDGLADIIVVASTFGGDLGKVWVYLGTDEGDEGIEAAPFWSREGAPGENLGTAVAPAGDVNGDGLADILISSLDSSAATRAGRAYLFLSRGGGFPQDPDWTVGGTAEDERYGSALGTAGDVDGDGFSDFIVGAPAPSGEGRAYLYAGGPGPISTTPAWTAAAGLPSTAFAAGVSTAGDANGDGYADVLVGEPRHDPVAGQNSDAGRILVFLGSAAGLSLTPDRSLPGSVEGGLLGFTTAPAGDVDGDGFGDILAGAPTVSFDLAGEVVLYHGAARFPSLTPAWSVEGDAPGRNLGLGPLASAGDVNGDGFGDVIVGGYDEKGQDPEKSIAILFLGSKEGLRPEPARTFLPDQTVVSPSALFAGSAGDVDGDGDDELFICHLGRTGEFTAEGRVVLYSGGPAGLSERPTWVRDGGQEGAYFGYSAASAGDVNGDGYADLVVSAIFSADAEGRQVGKVYLFLGSPSGLSLTPSWTAPGEQEGSAFGFGVISAGDVNADGFSDVLVSAFKFSGDFPLEGKAYLYLGSASGLSQTPAWTKTTGGANSRLGVLAAGDVDGDGRSDVVLGGLFYTSTLDQVGRAWLYLGTAEGLRDDPSWFAEGVEAFARFAIRADGAGDLDRDGRAEVIIGDVGGDLESRAFVYSGTPEGLSTAPAWVARSPQPGDRFGTPGAAGDVNGDGFPDLLVGAHRHDRPGEDKVGKAYLFLGNGGGLPRRPRQLRTASRTPIVFLGRSDSSDSFRLAIDGRSPAGRDRVWLEWEVKPVGVPFDGFGIGRGAAPADTGAPIAGEGSVVELTEVAGGLAPATPYKWRSRIASPNPFFPRSPWLSLPYGGITEAKLRTAPAIPPVTDLLCETVAGAVEVRWQNGAAYEAIELRRDGGEPILLLGGATGHLDPDPGPGRHEYVLVGIREGIRSPSQGSTATVRAVEELPAGLDVNVVLTPEAPRAWFTFTPRAGSLLRITLTDDDPGDANALYARWGEPARASAFDHAAEGRFRASQRLVIPAAREETLSVLAQTNVFGGSDNAVRLRVEEVEELALEGLTSRRAGAAESGQAVSAIVTGAGFESATGVATRFFLEERLQGGPGGRRAEAAEVLLASASRAEAVFDLGGAPPGSYDLEAVKEVDRGGGEVATFRARLPAVFEVTPRSLGPLLQVQAGGPRVTRARRATPLAVEYANVGDRELPAPLLLVTAPEGSELRAAGLGEPGGRRLLVLGAPAGGRPDRLAPGAAGRLPVEFRGAGCGACAELHDPRVSCCAGIEVWEFAPPRDAFVGWDRLAAPPGLEAAWESLRSPLSSLLGASWLEFHQSLARRARRLARRGADPRSTLAPFRLAVREAQGRAVGAIAGALRRAGSGAPEEGRLVAALSGGAVQAASRTDAQGGFLLEWIAEGRSYEIVVEGSAVVGANRGTVTGEASVLLEVPRGEDVLGLELEVTAGADRGLAPACPGCDESGLPGEPLVPPAELFVLASRWEVGLVASEDPNEKGGSTGPDDLVGRRPVIHYTVYFENKAEAGAPAQGVRIIDRLDGDRLDLSSFRIGRVELGSDSEAKSVSLQTEGYSVETRVAVLVPALGGLRAAPAGAGGGLPLQETLDVAVKVGLDLRTGELVWEMQSLTEDVFQGFLYPNDSSGRGQGSVSFSVSPRDEVAREDDIRNQAALRFDENAIFHTNEVSVPAALFFPEHEPRLPRPADGALEVPLGTGLCWEPVGRTERYEVAFGKVGEAPAMAETIEACFTPPPLEHAASYRWQVTAVSVSGRKTPGPIWSFTVEPPAPAPAGAAGDPAPPDGAVEVSRGTALSWASPTPPAHSYALYLWPAGEARPAAALIAGWSATTYQPPALECGRSYLWQVSSLSSPQVEATLGPQWRFTVRGHPFRRGDVDDSGDIDITDAINALGYLFTDGKEPPCLEAMDADASGVLDITDPIAILGFLFLGEEAPSAPFAACGCGPTEGDLGCRSFPACP